MPKKGLYFLTAALCGLLLTACGISEENLNKVTVARDALMEQKEQTEQLNGELTASDFSDEISELSAQYDEFTTINLERLKNKDVDELLPRIEELTASYKDLEDKITSARVSEENEAISNAKQIEVLCHIENLSGSELSSICYKDVAADSATDNYLAEGMTLKNGRILAGVTLPVNSDSSAFCLVVKDTLENTYEYAIDFGDLNAATGKEFSIKLNVPESGAEIN